MAFGRVAKQKAVVEPHLVGGALGTLLRSAAAGEGGEAAAVRTVLSSWMQQQSADEEHFASKAVFVEVRLRQALSASASLSCVLNSSKRSAARAPLAFSTFVRSASTSLNRWVLLLSRRGARVASVEPSTRQHNATTGSGASRTPMTDAASLLSCSSMSSGAIAILFRVLASTA